MTAYHVFKRTSVREGTPAYQQVGSSISARDDKHAIRIYLEKAADAGSAEQKASGELTDGVYVAVPERSWTERHTRVERTVAYRIGDAT